MKYISITDYNACNCSYRFIVFQFQKINFFFQDRCIERWMNNDHKGNKYCVLNINHNKFTHTKWKNRKKIVVQYHRTMEILQNKR